MLNAQNTSYSPGANLLGMGALADTAIQEQEVIDSMSDSPTICSVCKLSLEGWEYDEAHDHMNHCNHDEADALATLKFDKRFIKRYSTSLPLAYVPPLEDFIIFSIVKDRKNKVFFKKFKYRVKLLNIILDSF